MTRPQSELPRLGGRRVRLGAGATRDTTLSREAKERGERKRNQLQLAARGRQILDRVTPGREHRMRWHSDERVMRVWQTGPDGNQVLIAAHNDLLLGASVVPVDALLDAWLSGRRTSAADLDALGDGDPRRRPRASRG